MEASFLKIDEKWSVEYNPDNNDRPSAIFRYGQFHSYIGGHNVMIAMFYALLEKERIANKTQNEGE